MVTGLRSIYTVVPTRLVLAPSRFRQKVKREHDRRNIGARVQRFAQHPPVQGTIAELVEPVRRYE